MPSDGEFVTPKYGHLWQPNSENPLSIGGNRVEQLCIRDAKVEHFPKKGTGNLQTRWNITGAIKLGIHDRVLPSNGGSGAFQNTPALTIKDDPQALVKVWQIFPHIPGKPLNREWNTDRPLQLNAGPDHE